MLRLMIGLMLVFTSQIATLLPAMAQAPAPTTGQSAQGATQPATKPIDKPLEGISAEDLAEVVKATGFRAELKPFTTPNNPNGQLILTGMSGTPVTIAPVLCKDKLCRAIEFRARFANMPVTPVELNRWNQSKNFARTYQQADGTVLLSSEIDMGGGMTIRAVANGVRRFELLLGQFKSFDFKGTTGGQNPPAMDRRPVTPGSTPPAERRI